MAGTSVSRLRRFAARWLAPLAIALPLSSTGCGGAGDYVWADALPASASTPREYRISEGDTLTIRVLNHDALSTQGQVRPDGRLAFPMLGDVQLAGKKPSEVRNELSERLKSFIVSPDVTVSLNDHANLVAVVGEVRTPTVARLAPGWGVLQALASAGGLTELADKDRIFVLRRTAKSTLRIRFTYELLTRPEGPASQFPLQTNDVVVVE